MDDARCPASIAFARGQMTFHFNKMHVESAIAANTATSEFARRVEGAREVKCSEFGEAVVKRMG